MAYSAHVGTMELGGTATVISKQLPPGNYLLFASVELVNRDQGFSIGRCSIPGYATDNHVVTYEPSFVRGADSLSLASAIYHPGGTVDLTCTEDEADIDVQTATLTAIKVDSIG